MTRIAAILIGLCALCACGSSNDDVTISASACAEMVDGEIVECEVDRQTLEEFDVLRVFYEQLNTKYPWPEYFEDNKSYIVREITNNSHLVLENGLELALADLECTPEELRPYLVAVLLGDAPYKVSYLSTGYSDGQSEYAYVWEIPVRDDPSAENNVKSRGIPNWYNLNETALSNRWCLSKEESGHEYYNRFVELLEFYD